MLFPERFSSTVPHTTRSPRSVSTSSSPYRSSFQSRRDSRSGLLLRGKGIHGEYDNKRGDARIRGVQRLIDEEDDKEENSGNLYGTALAAVYDARKQGIPLLTPHSLALRLLRRPELRPFIIFIQPPDSTTFKVSFLLISRWIQITREAYKSRTSRAVSAVSSATCNTRGFTDIEIDQIIEGGEYGHKLRALSRWGPLSPVGDG